MFLNLILPHDQSSACTPSDSDSADSSSLAKAHASGMLPSHHKFEHDAVAHGTSGIDSSTGAGKM